MYCINKKLEELWRWKLCHIITVSCASRNLLLIRKTNKQIKYLGSIDIVQSVSVAFLGMSLKFLRASIVFLGAYVASSKNLRHFGGLEHCQAMT